MKKSLIAIAALSAMAFAATDYEVGGAIGRNAVSHSPISNYNLLNLRVGKYLPKNHVLRFELERSEKFGNKDLVKDEHLLRALVNVEHYFPIEDSKITPYAFVGAGYQWVSSEYDNNMVADLGVGAKYLVSSKWDAFAELRGLRDFSNNDNHYGILVGAVYKFGKTEPKVEKKTEPKPVVVIDRDKDGVADVKDLCPGTPGGVKVNEKGCPVDSDGDGVADYLDKCPNTPKDFKVDQNGCPVLFNFEIQFDYNSANIKPEYMERIQKFADFLKQHPEVKAEIQGHTDNKGSAAYNKKLSEKRAKAVYETLIKLGVSKEQLSYKGYGEENPIASNDTEEGRAKNRRVVAKLYF